tara:strand:- start:371 stop:607 length:237 start_codon:yes stop_codon:yes gene_type:complete
MREQGESEQNIKDVRRSFNVEIREHKEKVIKEIIDLHPKFYDPIVPFTDWKSSMKHLEDNRQYILLLLRQDADDKKTS